MSEDEVTVSIAAGIAPLIEATTSSGSSFGPDANYSIYLCLGETVALNASGGISYTWNPGTFLSSTTTSNTQSSPNTSISYSVEVDDGNGCITPVNIDLNVNLPVSNTIIETICSGESFEGYSSTGLHTDTFTGVNGCDSVRTLNLTVIGLRAPSTITKV